MSWRVEFTPHAEDQFDQLDNSVRKRIVKALAKLENSPNPQAHCKPLSGDLAGLWRYRIGDYRFIIDLLREELVILALDVDHRSRVYD